MKKLTKPMENTLKMMELGKQYSAYDLGVSLSTLFSLYNRKLVDYKVYNSWNLRIGVDWQITELGHKLKKGEIEWIMINL
jgi:hypothetical protein